MTESHARRAEVLEVLRAAESSVGVAEVAERLGIHPNTARFHLDELIRLGRVEAKPGTALGPGRPATTYQSVVQMDPGGPRQYRALAELLGEELAARPQATERATEIGRRWGRRLATEQATSPVRTARGARARIHRMLDRLGFAPDRGRGSGSISVRSCPFLELAQASTKLVCPIHLGLMQGALDTWQAPVTVGRLETFAEPDLCRVHLAPGREGAAQAGHG